MAALSEDVELEVEALHATYADDLVMSRQGPRLHLSVPVTPRDGDEHRHFVSAVLELKVGPGYPAQPPAVQVSGAKGLGDARVAALAGLVRSEAAALQGELMLGHLIETARDYATQENSPEGEWVWARSRAEGGADEEGKGGGGESMGGTPIHTSGPCGPAGQC